MTIQIIEIVGRSIQGVTRPYICRADDGNIYFVKGIGAGRRSQVYEWIAGNLALEVGLPIAPFELVDIPEELIKDNELYNDLGTGLAFGSLKQVITELNFSGIDQVQDEIQRAVLAFDWWIRNEDRTLTESGGNPNLFWEPDNEKLVVIDHNQAFDTDFSNSNFKLLHVFNQQANQLFDYATYRHEYESKFKKAMKSFGEICDNLPEEWYYSDPEMSVPADFKITNIENILNRCNKDSFWNTHE